MASLDIKFRIQELANSLYVKLLGVNLCSFNVLATFMANSVRLSIDLTNKFTCPAVPLSPECKIEIKAR
jgi:hypothetical protein